MVWKPVELPQLTSTEYLECGGGGGLLRGGRGG